MKGIILFLLGVLLLCTAVACRGVLQAQVEPQTREPPVLDAGIEEGPPAAAGSALGRLAYVSQGDIWVKDLPQGEPARLTDDGRNADPRWSPSGDWLVFTKAMALWAMRRDGSDAEALVAPGLPQQVAWSPTEDCLAYITEDGELVVRRPPAHWPWWTDGTLAPDPASRGTAQVTRFAWRPDGQWLAYQMLEYAGPGGDVPVRQVLRVARRDGAYSSELVAVDVEPDLSGDGVQLVGWSGDGEHVLFWQGQPAHEPSSTLVGGLTLMSVPAESGEAQGLATPTFVAPGVAVPAPLGVRVAVVGAGQEPGLERTLILLSAEGPSPLMLSRPQQLVAAQVPQVPPAWSPDGQSLAYAAMPAPAAADSDAVVDDEVLNERLAERRLWIVSADGREHRWLTDDAAYRDEWPRWSAAGGHILFLRVHDTVASLWLVGEDGGQLQRVAENVSIAAGAGYAEGHRLFDWWIGAPPPWQTDERVVSLGQGGGAQQAVVEFLEAVVAGEVDRAIEHWHLDAGDEGHLDAGTARQIVEQLSAYEGQFVVGLTTYEGPVGPGERRTLNASDPRADGADVEVMMGGIGQWFCLERVDDRWKIWGLLTE